MARKLFTNEFETIAVPSDTRVVSVDVVERDGVDFLIVKTEERPPSAGVQLGSVVVR